MDLRLDMEENGAWRTLEFSGAELTIGRGHDNAVVLDDRRCSRHHCRILRTPQGLILEDLHSSNGTILNGVAVTKILLKPGDEFHVGSTRFAAREPAAPAVQPQPPQHAPRPPAPPAPVAETVMDSARAAPRPREEEDAPPVDSPPDDSRYLLDEVEKEVAAGGEAPGEAFLEMVEGPEPGGKTAVERLPFTIGRAAKCDLRVDDARASSAHARIVREGDVFFIEDLGSMNGTLVNKRPVKRAMLMPGTIIQIGNAKFRAQVPPPPVHVKASDEESEEFIPFDAQKYLAPRKTEHPLAVAAIVLILAVVSYFTIDLTRGWVSHPVVDRPLETNLIQRNWSFEEPASGVTAGVPGWSLRRMQPRLGGGAGAPQEEGATATDTGGAEDFGRMAVTQDSAQPPGNQALRLASSVREDIVLATHEQIDIVVSTSTRQYRLSGHVANEGAFAAGLLVEWHGAAARGETSLGTSFCEAVHHQGDADVDQIVSVPYSASQALVSCFVMGPGSAVFDRVSLSPISQPEGAGGSTSPTDSDEAEPSGKVAQGPTWERSFRIGSAESSAVVKLNAEGTVWLGKKERALLWPGLSPEQDPYGFGPRLAPKRPGSADASSVVYVTEVPDVRGGRWITLETKAMVSGGELKIQWSAAPLHEGEPPVGLQIYVSSRKGPAADSREIAGSELVFGEGGERVSIDLPAPAKPSGITSLEDPSSTVMVAGGKGPAAEITVSAGARHESVAARACLEKAEEEFRSGKAGAAIQTLSRLKDLYPAQKAAVARAAERILQWQEQASAERKKLSDAAAELRATPTPVAYEILRDRVEKLAGRYEGTEEGKLAQGLLTEVDRFWKGRAGTAKDDELKSIHEAGKRLFSQNALNLAELYLRWVVEADPNGDAGQDAATTLKMIEGRRRRDMNIFLR